MEDAVDDAVPICWFCSKVRDDTGVEAGKGSWIDLSIYLIRRKLALSQGGAFSHGYCPDCIAHYHERLAAYRARMGFTEVIERSGASPHGKNR